MIIGEFARLAGVSVRMLRHYDAVGLLHPRAVDPATGYRSYSPDQLPRLHRIAALTALGFTLREVGTIVVDQAPAADVVHLLSLRRAGLQARIAADTARLASVESRLSATEAGAVSTHDTDRPPFTIRSLEPVRLAHLSAVAHVESPESSPVGRLFTELAHRLQAAAVAVAGPRTAHSLPLGGGRLAVHAGVVVAEGVALPRGVEEARLATVPVAACLVVAGATEDTDADLRTLAWWLRDNRYRYAHGAPAREVHLGPSRRDPAQIAVELQMSITPVGRGAGLSGVSPGPGVAAAPPSWRSSAAGRAEPCAPRRPRRS